ncbi:MAG: NAD(P)-dependent oxidoreductase, partial [Bacillota bacterium]|nr:NAD(P)-dependent oxidoreductase [Bacillota bacterium]
YIRTKYRAYVSLPACRLYDRIVVVFPTLVFGGDEAHPVSSLSSGLPDLRRFSWLLGHLNVEARFHFIHAEDIARIVRHLLEKPEVEKNYVLGNEPVSLGEFTKRAAKYFGHRIRWQITLSPRLLLRLGVLLGAKVSSWDYFCVRYQNFVYQSVSCPSFGLPTTHGTVEEIVADWEVIQRLRASLQSRRDI